MSSTAIILFAHLPGVEARVKTLAGSRAGKATQRLSAILTNHFYELAKQCKAETFLIDTRQQIGNNFGERISNAFADIYQKGFENVICIGNDCPDLSLDKIESAINQVESGNVVLGPAADGGAYLIGIPAKIFNQQSFKNVKWQTSVTYRQLNVLMQGLSSEVSQLEVLSDIDSEADLYKIRQSQLISYLLVVISSFINGFNHLYLRLKPEYFYVSASSLKGPPALFGAR